MTTHQPPYMPGPTGQDRGVPAHHRMPAYSVTGSPEQIKRYGAGPDADFISDREQSDRDARVDALDSAVRLFASLPENLRAIMTERDVLLLADTFAHYVASGIPGPARVLPVEVDLKLDGGAA